MALIDDKGRWWSEGTTALSRHLATDRGGDDLIPFVVRNMGYVQVTASGRLARVTFHARSVTPVALCAVLYFAQDNPGFAFVVEDGVSPPYLCTGPNKLVAKIGEYTRPRGPLYQETPIPIQRSAFAERWPAVRPLLEGAGSSDTTVRVLDALFGGHWTLSSLTEHLQYRFEALGSWYTTFDPERCRSLIGKTPASFGDRKFGQRVADGFTTLVDNNCPKAQRVAATLRWAGHAPRTYDFSRLLLPMRLADDRRYLLTAAVIH